MAVSLDKATIKPGMLIALSDNPRRPFGVITRLCMHGTGRDTKWCGRYVITLLTGGVTDYYYEDVVPLTQEDF